MLSFIIALFRDALFFFGIASGRGTFPKPLSRQEEAAAIAMALDQMTGPENGEELAAISMALYLYLNSNHDYESEVLTFNYDSENSTWAQKHFNFKQNPERR